PAEVVTRRLLLLDSSHFPGRVYTGDNLLNTHFTKACKVSGREMQNINRSMAKGAAWMVFFKITDRSIGLLSTMILAKLLLPADFGLVAMATAIIAMMELLGSFSFDLALIQKQQAEPRHYDTAWTFNVLYAVGAACVLLLLAWPVAHIYGEPRLQYI